MKIRKASIPVIDLFAGPGGLGEGFSSYFKGIYPFKIIASIEMEESAHETLELRSFFHEFTKDNVPMEYYQYVKGEILKEELFSKHPNEYEAAKKRAIKATLGSSDDKLIAQKIKDSLSKFKGAPWVLIGGPPCQAFSNIGRARRQANGIGKENQEKDTRNFLYKEYLKIIAKFKPTIFVMENVTGILSARVGGEKIFSSILSDLRAPGKIFNTDSKLNSDRELEYKIYSLVVKTNNDEELKPEDYVIRSERYGIPQRRHRVILLGIRKDCDIIPDILVPNNVPISTKDVLSDLPRLRSKFSKESDTLEKWNEYLTQIPKQSWFKQIRGEDSKSLSEFILNFSSKIGANLSTGGQFVKGKPKIEYRRDWYFDTKIDGFLNHESRGHIKEDISRYFYCSVYANLYGTSPRIKNFPKALLPKHVNIEEARKGGKFDDRFKVQLADKPSSTMTCHISKDGHYIIHYDPLQCRSLTVREAARLQTFPDNYFFEGPRTRQYHQVGNAVPPLLAFQIANIVYDVIKNYK